MFLLRLGLHPTNVRYEPAVYAVTPRSISKDSTCIAMSARSADTQGVARGVAALSPSPSLIRFHFCCVVVPKRTRAIGDYYAHQFGLTHVPSISVKRISCADSGSEDTTQAHTNSYATSEQAYTIFVASDGVWDWSVSIARGRCGTGELRR